MLCGLTTRVPNPSRLHTGAELLGRAIAHCPPPQRSWAMCALAWLRWALGIGIAAHDLVHAVAAVDPYNSLVPYYSMLIDRITPSWIFVEPPMPNRAARRQAARARR